MGPDGVMNCWTDSVSEALALRWDQDVLHDEKEFPGSSRRKTKLHLKFFRQLLSVPALNLVTHIAHEGFIIGHYKYIYIYIYRGDYYTGY